MKEKKNIFIMGDSYSTYSGYIPENYFCYYSDEREEAPIVDGVEKTWWKILSREKDFNIILNDSFSGSTICNTVREVCPIESSFVNRIDKYIAEGMFSSNRIDTMLIFGGTNDSWIDAPVGEVKYSQWSEEDLKEVLPAFCYLLSKAKEVVEDVIVIINTELKPEIIDNFISACENYQVQYVQLDNIDKENGHPTVLGMKQIAEQIGEHLSKTE